MERSNLTGGSMSLYGATESFGKTVLFNSKAEKGEKRNREELDEESDAGGKRVKMRDLHSILQSEGDATVDTEEQTDIIGTQGSQIVDKKAGKCRARILEGNGKKSYPLSGSKPLDLNKDLCTDENSYYNNDVMSLEESREQVKTFDGFGRCSLDGSQMNVTVEEVTSSASYDLFTYRASSTLKTKGMDEKDGVRKWNEMKLNGFVSTSHGGIPPSALAPKKRGRKSKNEMLNQKMEQAKKEQVDRFAKIAAPTGLLNGLNPGIINHVRNSKMVHSIIKALVMSEKEEMRNKSSEMNPELPVKNVGLDIGIGSLGSLPDSSGERGGYGKSTMVNQSEDGGLSLKLGSSNMISENTRCLSGEESASVDTLSVKGARVASQWLQLLHLDINGRLAALRRSKKRVRNVIATELPSLLSKEFESKQEDDPLITKDPASKSSMKAAAELHQAQWNKLFNQMDSSLSEEEKQLECWLNEVHRMLRLCDQGLEHVKWNMAVEMQRLGSFDNVSRSKIIDPKELPVRAAAASIYSTANYVSSS